MFKGIKTHFMQFHALMEHYRFCEEAARVPLPRRRVALLRDRRRERRRWGDAGETAVRHLNMITVPGQRAMTTRSPPLTRTA